jgi:hypothetical protein
MLAGYRAECVPKHRLPLALATPSAAAALAASPWIDDGRVQHFALELSSTAAWLQSETQDPTAAGKNGMRVRRGI